MKHYREKSTKEKQLLDKIAEKHLHNKGFNKYLLKFRAKKVVELSKGPKILEVGCGDGFITRELVLNFPSVVSIDGSRVRVKRAKTKVKNQNVKFIISLFEEFSSQEKFNTIVMCGILEHVEDPVYLLKKYSQLLEEDGIIIITVPNSASLHRRLGVKMGILKNLHELTEVDFEVGHKRYYNISLLTEHISKANLRIKTMGGIMLKLLSNSQMESWDKNLIYTLNDLASELPPEFCAEIYAVCCQKMKRNEK